VTVRKSADEGEFSWLTIGFGAILGAFMAEVFHYSIVGEIGGAAISGAILGLLVRQTFTSVMLGCFGGIGGGVFHVFGMGDHLHDFLLHFRLY
jgi:hypothetical protein